ncbi:hypothetical protein I3F58_14755 [Streptomyces sp. MUM 203J]|uniref:hypothetical protein n=1 Tax=Streptomyces sp. MUM 203J TaxID=2791990 RepID=UPI001F0379F3|nr:hypothetical protein [Streptomyces sp. MUM 203J]MCH0540806.1 hypothetical protein [Streptomyces sp. MUM 203J]
MTPRDPAAGPYDDPSDDPDYSATELASHWIQRPAPADLPTTGPGPAPAPGPHDTKPLPTTLLRFGPGVPPRAPVTPAPPPPRPPRRPAAWRRYTLPVLVYLCVLAFLAWQRYGPTVAVRDAVARTGGVVAPAGGGCGGTADIVGVVRTDGRPGTLTYRWVRNDGSTSPVLSERVRRGQEEARLHLKWTFSGQGVYAARADLEILTPTRHTASAVFTYTCYDRPPLIDW